MSLVNNFTVKKVRSSNLELLRLLSMFFVLVVYADFQALGMPDKTEMTVLPLFSVSRIIIEAFAIVCVNTFVLLSGWFGINFHIKSLCNLLFQCAFFLIGIYTFTVLIGIEPLSIGGIKKCLMLTNNVWFVKCYLGMFIMAPILNAFVEKTDKRTFSTVLLSFFIFQTIYGWFSNGAPYFEKGYSAFSFMGLYLLARYIRIYQPSYAQWSKSKNFLMYISLSLFTAIMLIITCYFDKVGYFCMFWTYTSPLVIAGALYLLLFFNRFAFQNTGINWIAASCFAVYLFHFFIWEYFMKPHIQQLAITYNGISCLLAITGLLLTFFTAAILIDKIRLYIWNHFVSKYIS